MELERLIAALDPVDVRRPAPLEVLDLTYDARAVRPGALFFCVPGMRADGHDFAAAALERGAVALVVERELELEAPQIVVASARAAMAPAADVFFGRPTQDLTLAGVTGTNGKTTSCFLVYEILAAAGRRPGLLGTVECRVGGERRKLARTTPEAIDLQRLFRAMIDAGDRSCVMEASSHAIELKRLDGVRFSALAFTNLSQDHLDFHRTMERYFAAKRRLFFSGDEVPAAINIDDAWGRRLAAELAAVGQEHVLSFGRSTDADLRPDELELGASGTRMRIGGLELESRLRGAFNAENILTAVALARLLGVEDEAIATGVAALEGVPGPLRGGRARPGVRAGRRLRAHAGCARASAAGGARAGAGKADLRLRLRRRPRPREAAADGRDRRRAGRPGDRHLRQSAQRGAGRDHRGDRGGYERRLGSGRAGARPAQRDRAGDRAGAPRAMWS